MRSIMVGAVTVSCAALILDMDGTLVDSTALVERLWTDFARQHGLDPGSVIGFAHGRPTATTVRHFLPRAQQDAVLRDFERRELDSEGVVEIRGAGALVRAARSMPVALVTSASRALAVRRMELAGIDVPAVVVTSEDVVNGKPSPDGFVLAARTLGVEPRDCLVLEDSQAGLAAAAAAGMRAVKVGMDQQADAPRVLEVADLDAVSLTGPDAGARFCIRLPG